MNYKKIMVFLIFHILYGNAFSFTERKIEKPTQDEISKMDGFVCDKFCLNPKYYKSKNENGADVFYMIDEYFLIVFEKDKNGNLKISSKTKIVSEQQEKIEEQEVDLEKILHKKSGETIAGITYTISSPYSGGGESFSQLSLFELPRQNKPERLLVEGIPYACYVTIRACFSEEEYHTSKNCSDQSYGALKIFSKTDDDVYFGFQWKESHWPQGVSKKYTTKLKKTFTLIDYLNSPEKIYEEIDFCRALKD